MAAKKSKAPTVNSTPIPSAAQVRNTERDIQRLEELVGNVQTTRLTLFNQLLDPRRDIDHECGYPDRVSIDQLQQLFDRNPFAQRVCEVMAKEAFQVSAKVYEDEDPENETQFEKDVDNLGNQIRGVKSWFKDDSGSLFDEALMRAAIQAAIGQFGVILIGLNDGKDLSEPAAGVEEYGTIPGVFDDNKPKSEKDKKKALTTNVRVITTNAEGETNFPDRLPYSLRRNPEVLQSVLTINAEGKTERVKGKRELTFLNVFSEASVMVTQWESNRSSPRFNQPVFYNITFNQDLGSQYSGYNPPMSTAMVHWTRVIHIPGPNNIHSNGLKAQSELEVLLRVLMNLDKLFAASGEGYWKSCFVGLALSTHPQLGKNVKVDKVDLKSQMENWDNSLTRTLYLMGMEATTIAPQVIDPTPFIERNVEAICIKKGIPKRIFLGSERGELSSSQDEGDWNDKLAAYWKQYLIPRVFVPVYDRLIMVGVLSEPGEDGYHIDVPDMDAQTAKEKADVALVITQAMQTAVTSGLFTSGLIDEYSWLTGVCKFPEDEVEQWLEAAEQRQAEFDDESQALADEHGMVPTPPQGMEWDDPQPEPQMPIKVKDGEKLVDPATVTGGAS